MGCRVNNGFPKIHILLAAAAAAIHISDMLLLFTLFEIYLATTETLTEQEDNDLCIIIGNKAAQHHSHPMRQHITISKQEEKVLVASLSGLAFC